AAGRQDGTRRALAALLAGAEHTLGLLGPDPDPDAAARLRDWEQAVRRRAALPVPARAVPLAVTRPAPWSRRLPALGPLAARTFLGCLLAGLAAHALGVGRPAWALVTAASLYQANLSLTWSRALQRTLGNLLGVLVFAAVAPTLLRTPLLLVLALLACGFGAEALITRNYWLGTVCVTPMALLLTEFGSAAPTSVLVADRALDTLVGAVVGMLAALAVANRRAVDRIGRAVSAVHTARVHTEAALAASSAELTHRRGRQLSAALVELRTAADTAAGEWRAGVLPEQEVRQAEAAGHRTLAAAVRSHGVRLPEPVQEAQAA
ncbi:FUSC family protein, partial [Streptacidiphilus monticola]